MKKLMMKVLAICVSAFMCFGMYPIITFASSTTETITVSGTYDYSKAYEVLDMVNEERTAEGLSPVTMDKDLMDAAMQRAAECSVYFSHTRPSGESCFTISNKAFAENIAAGQLTASWVMSSWMNSSGHKANILGERYQSIGVGCFATGGNVYWVQLFGIESATQTAQPGNQEVSVSVVIDPDLIGWSSSEEDPADTEEAETPDETPQSGQEQEPDDEPQPDDEAQPDDEIQPDDETQPDDEAQPDDEPRPDEDVTEDSDAESNPNEEIPEEPGGKSSSDEETTGDSGTDSQTTEPTNEEPSYGFRVSQLSPSDSFKVDDVYSTHADGTNTYRVYFYTDAEEQWVDDNVTFTVEDVTSSGMRSVMEDAGISYVEPVISVSSVYEATYVYSPITENGPDYSVIEAKSGKEITVETGQSTRCIKTTAYKDGEAIDSVYTRCAGGADGGYSAADKELFERACASIEAQLWDETMTSLEKLQAFADYISSVSHYPNTDTTNATYNPEWAAIWNEDGITDYRLLWSDFADQYVDWTMALQGGQSTGLAVNMLYEIALNDLGLTGISADDTGAGEGVFVGGGTDSTGLSSGADNSLVYQATDGTRTAIDAQGMSYSAVSPYVTCSAHGCQDKIIPISGDSETYDQSEEDSLGDAESEDASEDDADSLEAEDETEDETVEDSEWEYLMYEEDIHAEESEDLDEPEGEYITLRDDGGYYLPESAEKEPTSGVQQVKTGDTNSLILYVILVACGIVILCSSMLLIRRFPE